LQTAGNELRLRFSGQDPGIAIDLRSQDLASGPYRLVFRLKSNAAQGEVFYTTDPKTILPNGKKVTFSIDASEDWQDVRVSLPTDKQLKQLRLDIGDGPGEAIVADLQLLDAAGGLLNRWPPAGKN
jgi:arylsulfatase